MSHTRLRMHDVPLTDVTGEGTPLLGEPVDIIGGQSMNLSEVRDIYQRYHALLDDLYEEAGSAEGFSMPAREAVFIDDGDCSEGTFKKTACCVVCGAIGSCVCCATGAGLFFGVTNVDLVGLGITLMAAGISFPTVFAGLELSNRACHRWNSMRFRQKEEEARKILVEVVGVEAPAFGTKDEMLRLFLEKFPALNTEDAAAPPAAFRMVRS